jgi:hypothetical protein
MKGFYVVLLVTLFSFLAACETTPPGNGPNNPSNTAKLSATTPKNYTVALSWETQSGTVTLERKLEDGDFTQLADVSGKTSFEDFPVFDDTTYTYRLKAGGGQSDVTLKVPAVTPNPFTITLTPDSSKSVKQTISTSGGTIRATGTNGVVYTLTIPADALLQDTEITLTPISQIGNLPLSGGLLGAVKIEPEDLEFYNYTTLTMTATPAVPATTTAVGFASSTTGTEFHLYPFAAETPPSEIQAQQDDDYLAPLAPSKGGTYGAGAGTAGDVKKQTQEHPPTDQTAQTEQKTVVEEDDLAPIATPTQMAGGWAIRLALRELNSPSGQTLQVFREFRQWLEYLRKHNLEKQFDPDIKTHSKAIANLISKRFDELYQTCEAGDRSVRKEMKELLHWSKLYPALVQNLGSAWFSEAQDRVKLCGIPNWEGTASLSDSKGVLGGYSGSAAVTWFVDTVNDDVVTYVATASDVQFDIASGNGCTATVNSAEPELEKSFLMVDFSATPAIYSGGFFVNVSFTITCDDDTQTFTPPFPVMFPTLNETVSSNDKVISGSYESGPTSSTWTFNAVPRSNP